VNLAGLEREVVERGDVLGHVGDWPTTTTLEAWIERVRGLRHPLGSRGAFTLHVGSAEREVTIRVYGVDDVDEDGAFVRIRAARPVAIDVGDRFVLRESGRRETVAGGVVLDADPPSRPGRDAERRLAARASASRSELPALAVGERGVVRSVDADRLAGDHVERIDGAERIGEAWISRPLMAEIGAEVTSALDDDARDVAGIRSEVEALLRRRRLDAAGVATDIVERLVIDGTLTRDGARISRAGRRVARDDDDVTRLVDAIAAAEPTPPTVAELHARGLPIAALGSAVASGALVRLTPELVVTRSLVDRAIDEVRATGAEGITVSALRQALGTSRRYAVPLMEHLDRIGETRRAGDLRFARGV